MARDPAAHATYMREYRKRPGNAAKHRQWSAAWAASHRDERNAYTGDYRSRPGPAAAKAAADAEYAARPETKRSRKAYRVANAERISYYQAANYAARGRELLDITKYGLPPGGRQRLTDAQGGVCAIPGCAFVGALQLDHHHGRNEVRGMLCNTHNIRLVRLDAAADALCWAGVGTAAARGYLLGAGFAVELVDYIQCPPASRLDLAA